MKLQPSRKQAIQAGARFYQTVKPCKNGHFAPRYTHNGACVECTRIGNERSRKAVREALDAAV